MSTVTESLDAAALEKRQQELVDKAIAERRKANDLAKRIKDLEAEKATADKAAAAADRSIDTHFKCMAGGILFEAMRKESLLSASAKAEIVKLFHARIPKIGDRAEIKRRYVGFTDLPEKPEVKPKAAAPVAPTCRCGATMLRGQWLTNNVSVKGWQCPSAFLDGKREIEHEIKADGGAA